MFLILSYVSYHGGVDFMSKPVQALFTQSEFFAFWANRRPNLFRLLVMFLRVVFGTTGWSAVPLCCLLKYFLISLLLFGTTANAAPFPKELKKALENAEEFELISLQPHVGPPVESSTNFRGWAVLGRTMITNPVTRGKLIKAFVRSAEKNRYGGSSCFAPRHAIRLVYQGKPWDITICFECENVYVYVNGERSRSMLFHVTDFAAPLFNEVLRATNIPLADGILPYPGK